MKRFPSIVRDAMTATGAATTCVPVQLDGQAWETAVFFQLAGPECKNDRRRLKGTTNNVPLGIDVDLIEHASAAVCVVRFEVYTDEDDPLVGEVLLTPGNITGHFDTLKLLTSQSRLCWFFGDQTFWILHSQQHPLVKEQHDEFEQLLANAVKHDALIRITGRYDANAALSEVVSNYELRAGTTRMVPSQDADKARKN